MFATISSIALIPLVVCVGICVPALGLHFELADRRETRYRAELERRAHVIKDHEATIDAYRHVIALEMEGLESSPIEANY